MTEKININDGQEDIKSISIICLFRNNEEYLKYFIEKMTNMEKMYNLTFFYYFLENNSKDNTRKILQDFIKNRKGKLILYNLKKDYVDKNLNFDRTNTLAKLRNLLKNNITPLKSKWSFMVDSKIYFNEPIIKEFFDMKPGTRNIGLMGPMTQEHIEVKIVKMLNPNFKTNKRDDEYMTFNHFYDTYALSRTDGKNYWPNCIFKSCDMCKKWTKCKIDIIDDTIVDFIELGSTYGGFTLIDSNIYNDKNVKWETVSFSDKFSLCEHILFCKYLKSYYPDKLIGIATKIKDLYWTK